MVSKTGAELLVETLQAAGVQYLFTLSGNQILSIYDATIGRDIELIHTRHEAAAIHMADGWGRLTEQPGVALVTAGPGHCNSLSALYVALMSESPLVLLSGHCPRAEMGRGAFQEIDQVATAKPVTKAAWLVEEADRVGEETATALRLAREGRPGPVHLSLPVDVLEATTSATLKIPLAADENRQGRRLDQERIQELLNLLAEAKHPLILAGPAMMRPLRWKDVERLSEATGVPCLPMESPRGMNDPWLHGATNCVSRADTVLLVARKLDFTLGFGRPPFFSEKCRFLQIDADEEQLRENERIVWKIREDPSLVVRHLTRSAQQRRGQPGSWKEEVLASRNATPLEWDKLRHSTQQPIHPLRVCQALQTFLDDGAVLVSDGGEFGQWMQSGLEAEIRLINGPGGAIGNCLSMGLAAKLVHPDRHILVLSGDGAFGFHALELDTALRHHLPVVAIVGNDARWNAEQQLQIQNYGADRVVGCDLLASRYDKVAQALGGYGEFVVRPDQLTPALERAVRSGSPACVNIAIEGAKAPTFRSQAGGGVVDPHR